MTSSEHQQAPGPGPAEIPLSSITVQLGLLDVLTPAFVRRHVALPYEVADQTLRLVAARPGDTLLLDEIAYCTGLRVEAAAPQGDGLPKVIEACIEAWSRDERTFVTTSAGGAVGDADLVYLEDLGSLAASASSSTVPSGPITFGEPGDFAELGSVGALADVGAAAAVAPVARQPHAQALPDSDGLPAVVDLKPRVTSSQRTAVLRGGQEMTPSAQATMPESKGLADDDLYGDVDLLDDVDLLEVDEEDVTGSGEQPQWERTLTGVPDHRPAQGLNILLASGVEPERRQLANIARTLGFAVQDVTRTIEVLQGIESRAVDLLVLDADLEGTHPYTLARQLRAEQQHTDLAIVVAGRLPRRWELVADLAKTYGVDAYLEKPFDTATLLWTLETALESRREAFGGLRDPVGITEARELLSQGASLYRKGAVDEAVDLFRRGLEHDPFAAKLHVSLAIALVKQRAPYAAMEAFERAIWLDPSLTTALQNLAVLYEKKGFRNKAIELWTQTLHATMEEEKRGKLRARIAKLL